MSLIYGKKKNSRLEKENVINQPMERWEEFEFDKPDNNPTPSPLRTVKGRPASFNTGNYIV
jgi:hypothetical protein